MLIGIDSNLAVLILDVGLTALIFVLLLRQIRGTRAARLLLGVAILYAVYTAANTLGLHILSQVMQAGALVGAIALVVVFGPELRRGLDQLGRVGSLTWIFAPSTDSVERLTQELARTAAMLSRARQGALLVLERDTGLADLAATGIALHADLSAELLLALFQPPGPLHDGAVIIAGNRIVAAGVVLPLSETSAAGTQRLGTRHRAALGLSEQNDALVVVVSEESGQISLAEHGRFVRDLDEGRLRAALRKRLSPAFPGRPGPLRNLRPRTDRRLPSRRRRKRDSLARS